MKNLPAQHIEVCICAAIRLPCGYVVRGHRHSDCIRTAAERTDWRHELGIEPAPWGPGMAEDQGFVTSRGRYVDRTEGLRLQVDAGIASIAEGGYRCVLFSEDLY